MIYKDAKSVNDIGQRPEERKGERCLHCGQEWVYHQGWGCFKFGYFDDIHPKERYETQSMRLSISVVDNAITSSTKVSVADKKPIDLSDWKVWRSQGVGECPCGIAKVRCDYHR